MSKILFLVFEVESFPFASIYKDLEILGHETIFVNCDSWSFLHSDLITNWYDKNGVTPKYNILSLLDELNNNRDQTIDWGYLSYFEKKYCCVKSIQQLIMSDHVHNHSFRTPYYNTGSKKDLYLFTYLRLKWCEEIFAKENPDYIFSINNNYFIKNVFFEISKKLSVPYYTLINTRVGKKCLFFDNFCYGTPSSIVQKMETYEDESLKSTSDYISQYFENSSFTLYEGSATESLVLKRGLGLKDAFYRYYTWIKTFTKQQVFESKNKKKTKHLELNLMESNQLYLHAYNLKIFWNQIRFVLCSKFYFEKKIPRGKFIYFGLHMLPESSTLTLSTEYYELDLIRFMSKELPVDFYLVVKENPTMVGERPFIFYQEILKLNNVILLNPYVDSKSVLKRSAGVTGITGTILLEGALKGLPTHCFGSPEFKNIIDYYGHEGFADFIKSVQLDIDHSKRKNRALRYYNYILENGFDLSLPDLLYKQGTVGYYQNVQIFKNSIIEILKKGRVA